jgi:hypothetical protein
MNKKSEKTEKHHLQKLLDYFHLDAEEFSKSICIDKTRISQILNNKYGISSQLAKTIIAKYNNVNYEWLRHGTGNMISGINIQQIGDINDNSGIGNIGQNEGVINIHQNEGKEKILEAEKKHVEYTYDTLCRELSRFHERNEKQDEYIEKNIDERREYLDRIISNSYQRNERNMERIDKLIEIIQLQTAKQQEQSDKILDILMDKIKEK